MLEAVQEEEVVDQKEGVGSWVQLRSTVSMKLIEGNQTYRSEKGEDLLEGVYRRRRYLVNHR